MDTEKAVAQAEQLGIEAQQQLELHRGGGIFRSRELWHHRKASKYSYSNELN